MASRLTGFSKLLITLFILALLFFAGRYILNNTGIGANLKDQAEKAKQEAASEKGTKGSTSTTGSTTTPGKSRKDDNTLRVQLVTWGGYAPGLYFNEGAAASMQSRFYKDYGFKVEFVLNNDLFNALDAWIAGEYDVLVQTADAFPLYTAPDDINALDPRVFMQVDWSRGGDAIIAKRGINSINDLKGKTIAVAAPSPAQTLLISSLEAAGLKYSDVKVNKTPDNFLAAEQFKSDDNVDAAVVWSPDDVIATRDVPGSKILVTTKEQSNIIADIFFASQDFINNNRQMINDFYEGWMKGAAELKNKANHAKAAEYLATLNSISAEDAQFMMDNVYWTSHEDNKNFFGLNRDFNGVEGADLYGKMSKKFVEIGDAEKVAPSWRSIIYTGAVMNADQKLKGAAYAAEKAKDFKITKADYDAKPISSKQVSINFNTGQYQLSPNAKTIIDLQFADVAKTFGNAKIRIEGNTDNVGGYDMNVSLSKKRAQSVANYLQKQYGMNPGRFIIIGNGPSKPVAGCETNATESCKARNRRTDFELVK